MSAVETSRSNIESYSCRNAFIRYHGLARRRSNNGNIVPAKLSHSEELAGITIIRRHKARPFITAYRLTMEENRLAFPLPLVKRLDETSVVLGRGRPAWWRYMTTTIYIYICMYEYRKIAIYNFIATCIKMRETGSRERTILVRVKYWQPARKNPFYDKGQLGEISSKS